MRRPTNVSLHFLHVRRFMVLAGLISMSATGLAQLNSSVATVTLTATLSESLTVAATPTTVTFALIAGGTANGSAPVAMTTTWVLGASRANVVLVGFFTSAASALTNGTVNIPSSEVYGTVATGTPTTATAFTQSGVVGTASAGLTMFTQPLTASNRAATRTDNLALQINLTAQPQLPASTYTGTLNLEAQAL